jgi:hypothetical protein
MQRRSISAYVFLKNTLPSLTSQQKTDSFTEAEGKSISEKIDGIVTAASSSIKDIVNDRAKIFSIGLANVVRIDFVNLYEAGEKFFTAWSAKAPVRMSRSVSQNIILTSLKFIDSSTES